MAGTARRVALVPAAGGGTRFGSGVPKQYADLAGRPLLARTLDRLAASLALDAIVVAIAPDDTLYDRLVGPRPGVDVLRCGGGTRAETVANALAALAGRCAADDWIVVHDAARPCVPADALRRLVAELGDDAVGGLLALPVADTLKREDTATPARVLRTEPRVGLWQAQTPQMFRYGVLRAAFASTAAVTTTDEAQAVEALAATGACGRPWLVTGSPLNLKVTWPADLALAAAILRFQEHST
ncbi:MAG: 2-C-methyl-D-erythritol 4-phosphate cytidylyltransferase [Betaproteobacteria bacterium]